MTDDRTVRIVRLSRLRTLIDGLNASNVSDLSFQHEPPSRSRVWIVRREIARQYPRLRACLPVVPSADPADPWILLLCLRTDPPEWCDAFARLFEYQIPTARNGKEG